jgi:hypothetical protein
VEVVGGLEEPFRLTITIFTTLQAAVPACFLLLVGFWWSEKYVETPSPP